MKKVNHANCRYVIRTCKVNTFSPRILAASFSKTQGIWFRKKQKCVAGWWFKQFYIGWFGGLKLDQWDAAKYSSKQRKGFYVRRNRKKCVQRVKNITVFSRIRLSHEDLTLHSCVQKTNNSENFEWNCKRRSTVRRTSIAPKRRLHLLSQEENNSSIACFRKVINEHV